MVAFSLTEISITTESSWVMGEAMLTYNTMLLQTYQLADKIDSRGGVQIQNIIHY
jgi:hypothetical protein